MKTKNMKTSQVRNSVNRSPLRGFPPSRSYGAAGLLIPLSLMLTCFALSPMAQAVGPDTDGAIPGSNNGEGVGVLVSRTTGVWNTGTGFEALNHVTAGNQNTATGLRALFSDTSGGFNTATGVYSLFSNTSGFFNSATGAYSLAHNTIASYNTANGYSALYFNTEGEANTATGFAALYKNTTGFSNTANGYQALYSNTIGRNNTAAGDSALQNNTTGITNTANGVSALQNNTTGAENTALGNQALQFNTSGNNNIAVGSGAGHNLTTGANNIDIGSSGVMPESDTIRIGISQSATFIAGINGTAVTGTAVVVNGSGQLGVAASSQRFKDEIKPMDKASEAILALKPVTFRYKQEIDPVRIPQFGLVAEQVEKVDPNLVARDAEGKVYTVRYEAVNAMLLNEFLKEHRKVEEQEAAIT
ncbi:MAG TPA: tail fiber domain-containing protein, partial [Candidatus Binatia bacterium]